MRMETSRPARQVGKQAKTSVKVIWSTIIEHWLFDTVLAMHAAPKIRKPCHQRSEHKVETVDSEGVCNHVSEAVNKYQVQGSQQLSVREK